MPTISLVPVASPIFTCQPLNDASLILMAVVLQRCQMAFIAPLLLILMPCNNSLLPQSALTNIFCVFFSNLTSSIIFSVSFLRLSPLPTQIDCPLSLEMFHPITSDILWVSCVCICFLFYTANTLRVGTTDLLIPST